VNEAASVPSPGVEAWRVGFCAQVSYGRRVEGAAPYAIMWCDESCSYHQGYVGDEIVFATMGVKFVERERRGLEIAPDRVGAEVEVPQYSGAAVQSVVFGMVWAPHSLTPS